MKKFFFTLIILTVSSFVNAQSIEFVDSKSSTFYLTQTGVTDCKIHFKNITGKTLNLKYKKVSEDVNPNWIYTICDNINCYGNLVDTGNYYPIAIGETTEMKISVNTMGIADTNKIVYALQNPETPTVWDTLTFTFVLQYNLNTTLPAAVKDIQLFPNPAKNTVYIANAENCTYTISELSGKQVASGSVSDNTINISQLKGVYFIQIIQNNHAVVQRLVVE